MRYVFLAAFAAMAAACAPMVEADAEPEAEFMMTGPIPVVPGGF